MRLKSASIYWIHLEEHTDPLTEGYLGVSKCVEERLNGHLKDIRAGKHKNPHLVRVVEKYGWENLVKDVLLNGEEAYCYEIEEQMRPKKTIGWNIAPGGHRGPGWTKGKKKSQASIERQRLKMLPFLEKKRDDKNKRREERLAEREKKRLAKQIEKEDRKKKREARAKEKERLEEIKKARQETRIQKSINNGSYGISPDHSSRPMCNSCNKVPCKVNYIKNGVPHYRRQCASCISPKSKLPPFKPRWAAGGYQKKPHCDCCGFKAAYSAQLVVYHINGNLEDCSLHNLRTVCLNCIEVVKRTQVNWRRGDLQVDR